MSVVADQLAIDLRDVVKIYRRRVFALQGINLHVRRGEVFGLLGPNGAGKSTLVKIMMTVVRPTRASGSILGRPVGNKAALARVGYLPENHRLPRYLTGRQVLEFFAALAKVDRATRRSRAARLLETVGMQQWADTRISTYSKGMLQRIGLAQALVHDPELIVLDEPTDGVDPLGRRDILQVLTQLRQQGKTVFVNSHALSELEEICDRVAILVRGQVARQGTLDELTIARQRYEIEIASDDPINGAGRLRAALAQVQWTGGTDVAAATASTVLPPGAGLVQRGKLPQGTRIELEGAVVRIETANAAVAQPLIDSIRKAGLVIRRVQQVRPSLEELFMETMIDPTTGQRATPGGQLKSNKGATPAC